MTFEEWWKETAGHLSISTDKMFAEAGWEARVPKGYVIVPEEPTDKMVRAASGSAEYADTARTVYKAMIRAATKLEGDQYISVQLNDLKQIEDAIAFELGGEPCGLHEAHLLVKAMISAAQED